MADAEEREIVADHRHHRGDGALAERDKPLAFGSIGVPVAEFLRQRRAERDQVVAGIEPLGDLADLRAQRLAVAQVGRTGEHVDLAAGIVDVVFADDLVPGRFEQARQRVADHRAAAVAHVHRPGRVGRDVFDVDRGPAALAGTAIGGAERRQRAQLGQPGGFRQPQVDEPRPGDLGARDFGQLRQFGGQRFGQLARVDPRRLAQHHRRVGRQVAVRGIARRLDRDRTASQTPGQRAGCLQRIERSVEMIGECGVESLGSGHGRAVSRFGRTRKPRSEIAAKA